jgi:hypothetical protein
VDGKTLLRWSLFLVCIAGTTLGLINTYGDNQDVLALAQAAACGKDDCAYSLLRESRSAIRHSYGFQVRLVERGKREQSASVDVDCKRALLLIGAWSCAVKSGTPP